MTPAVIDPATWIDHSWLVTGTGVLFCIAGSSHTTSAVAGCAYYLRDDVATDLRSRLGLAPARSDRGLTYAGATYRKLPDLAPPTAWPNLHAGLHRHGITALPWSLLAAIDPNRAITHLDPRDAARRAVQLPLHRHQCGQTVLRRLLTDLDQPGHGGGVLGLTGSAALDPARLCTAPDLDLLTYPDLDPAALTRAIHASGGQYLADLPPDDPRLTAYTASRFLPASPRAAEARARLWSRRHDVAWIGNLRLDLTPVPNHAQTAHQLPYTAADRGPIITTLTLDTVSSGYPAQLTGRTRPGDRLAVLVTARGYDSVLRPGDQIHLSGRLHAHPGEARFASVDDHPGHHLHLEPP
jgi:hypothetical protein